MFSRKPKVLYKLTSREQGRLEAFSMMQTLASQAHLGVLTDIMKREKIPANDSVVFDAKANAFVRQPKA